MNAIQKSIRRQDAKQAKNAAFQRRATARQFGTGPSASGPSAGRSSGT